MARRGMGWSGCFFLSFPQAKPIFSQSKMDFLGTGDRNCPSAPPITLHHTAWACVSKMSVINGAGCQADLCSKRSGMGLHCGWLCVNELVSAQERACVCQRLKRHIIARKDKNKIKKIWALEHIFGCLQYLLTKTTHNPGSLRLTRLGDFSFSLKKNY